MIGPLGANHLENWWAQSNWMKMLRIHLQCSRWARFFHCVVLIEVMGQNDSKYRFETILTFRYHMKIVNSIKIVFKITRSWYIVSGSIDGAGMLCHAMRWIGPESVHKMLGDTPCPGLLSDIATWLDVVMLCMYEGRDEAERHVSGKGCAVCLLEGAVGSPEWAQGLKFVTTLCFLLIWNELKEALNH